MVSSELQEVGALLPLEPRTPLGNTLRPVCAAALRAPAGVQVGTQVCWSPSEPACQAGCGVEGPRRDPLSTHL